MSVPLPQAPRSLAGLAPLLTVGAGGLLGLAVMGLGAGPDGDGGDGDGAGEQADGASHVSAAAVVPACIAQVHRGGV